MTPAPKRTPSKPGDKYRIFGTNPASPAEKLTKAERDRRAHNADLRTPRCITCAAARESRAGLLCEKCKRDRRP